jgi:hypothetical protein
MELLSVVSVATVISVVFGHCGHVKVKFWFVQGNCIFWEWNKVVSINWLLCFILSGILISCLHLYLAVTCSGHVCRRAANSDYCQRTVCLSACNWTPSSGRSFLKFLCFGFFVKAIPLQALTDPEGSRRLRLPYFKTVGTWRWNRPPLPAGNIPGTHFC